ncbi:11166_t:CDS:2, partial [Entrophospora sp. SA101]
KFMLHTPTKSEESILKDHLLHITVSNGLAFRWIESEENNMHPICQYDFVTTCPIPNTNWTFGSKYWTNWTYEKRKDRLGKKLNKTLQDPANNILLRDLDELEKELEKYDNDGDENNLLPA